MKSSINKQRGFGFIGLLVLIVVIGLIAFIGVKVMDMRSAKPIVSDSGSSPSSVSAKISSKADLQNAASTLDASNISSVDLTQLDSDLNALL